MACQMVDADTVIREREARLLMEKGEASRRQAAEGDKSDVRFVEVLLENASSRKRRALEDGITDDDDLGEESADDVAIDDSASSTAANILHELGSTQPWSGAPMAKSISPRQSYPVSESFDAFAAEPLSTCATPVSHSRNKRRATVIHMDDRIADLPVRATGLESRNRELDAITLQVSHLSRSIDSLQYDCFPQPTKQTHDLVVQLMNDHYQQVTQQMNQLTLLNSRTSPTAMDITAIKNEVRHCSDRIASLERAQEHAQ